MADRLSNPKSKGPNVSSRLKSEYTVFAFKSKSKTRSNYSDYNTPFFPNDFFFPAK
jgi:hypothetical protein